MPLAYILFVSIFVFYHFFNIARQGVKSLTLIFKITVILLVCIIYWRGGS